MGQTLTHGVYLPDEGERNCYDELASNWSILDGAVGTVAEHTSQIAGKAADSGVVHKTGNETIEGVKSFLNTNIRFNSSEYVSGTPSANIFYAPILIGGVVNNADKNTFQHNAAIRTTGINDYSIRVYSQTSNTLTGVVSETNADASNISFRPIANNTHNLGTSSYKWKSLNGINPGALSLPKIVAKATADISAAIVGSDGETQYLNGSDNYYTAALDGWISMCIGGFTQSNELWITVYDHQNETWGTSAVSSTSARNTLFTIFPIRANQKMRIRMKCTTVTYARFYPCEGNV